MTSPRAPGRAFDSASADEQPRWRGALLVVLGGLALAVPFFAAYRDTIQKLVDHWSSNDMYSYGFLVPGISAYLIWLRRGVLATRPIAPSFAAGIPLLGLGLGLLIVGRVAAVNLVEELSLPVTVWGMALLVLGRAMTQSLIFPLAYLFTMIPFWDVFTGRLHLPFQLYSAAMGVGALRLLDIPVLHQGVLIELPNVTLEVAELCSGVNNLVAILCIGVPLTHFYVKGWPRRLAIMVAAALIALISNGVRVATVCLFAYYGIRGPNGDIHGPFSLMRSLMISGVGFFALFWLIARFAESDQQPPVEQTQRRAVPATAMKTVAAAVVLAMGLLLVAGGFERWRPVEPVPLQSALVGFPTTIGRWNAQSEGIPEREFGSLDFDAKLVRNYAAADGAQVSLLLGYLERQEQGRELAGSAFIDGLGEGARGLGSGGIRDGFVTGAAGRTYVMVAYVVDGQLIAGDYQAKWRTLRNVLVERRSNGGIVVLGARVGEGDSVEAVRQRYRDFMDGALPTAAALLAGGH